MKIEGSVMLVTGANRGVGSAFGREALRRGASRVYACARDVGTLSHLQSEGGSRVVPLKLDVTDAAQVAAAAAEAKDVTLLINNAGVMNGTGVLSAPELDGARQEMEVNYFAPLALIRAFAPTLAGGGTIVNVLSFLSLVTLPSMGTYSASKAAGLAMTRSARAELARQGTRVLACMPVQVDTEMGAAMPEPRLTPAEVAADTLDAVERGEEEVFPGELSRAAAAGFSSDPKALQKQMSQHLPA